MKNQEQPQNKSNKMAWQNPKFKDNIPVELVWLESTPHKREKMTYVNTYLYNGHKIKTKECHQLHECLDYGTFEIYVGQN